MTETAILSAVVGVGVALLFDEFHDVPPNVREAIERGEYVLAIKRVRQATGIGLREAKDVVDEIRRRAPVYRAGQAG